MKITAEFNSNEELLSFISTFGAKNFVPSQGSAAAPVAPTVKEKVKEDKPKKTVAPTDDTEIKETVQLHSPDEEDAATTENNETPKEDPKEEKQEDTKVTMEMVRERLGKIMKSGKQKEAKELVSKYGASKVPEIKEEDYAAIYKEAEALL